MTKSKTKSSFTIPEISVDPSPVNALLDERTASILWTLGNVEEMQSALEAWCELTDESGLHY